MGEGQSKFQPDYNSDDPGSLSPKMENNNSSHNHDPKSPKIKKKKKAKVHLHKRMKSGERRRSKASLKTGEGNTTERMYMQREILKNSRIMRREKVLELSKNAKNTFLSDSENEHKSFLSNSSIITNISVQGREQNTFPPGPQGRRRSHSLKETNVSVANKKETLRTTQSELHTAANNAGGAYLSQNPPNNNNNNNNNNNDSSSDSVDWDALDDSEISESSEESEEAKPKDYSTVLEFLTTLDAKKMNEVGQRVSKLVPGFMKHLSYVVEDYKDELIALGDDSDEFDYNNDNNNDEEIKIEEKLQEQQLHGFNWNEHFQKIINDLKEHGEIQEQRVRCYRELSNLALDFIQCAKTYGRLIISEAETPLKNKIIPPTKIGGFAGGDKYIVNNILFKFAVDSHGLFDCEEAAHKVAGHDLKGLISYFNLGIAGLHFPLMALVDYLGYRLIAISVLPICNDTLVYGSADAGTTVHNSSHELAKKMTISSKLLNLKIHTVGLKPTEQVEMYTAGDVEGHHVEDKFYLLDFSRSFPPCTFDIAKKNSYLYRLLRPEFVKNYKIPLCSDAYSGFVTIGAKEHIKEVEDATRYLLREIVPKIAEKLDSLSHIKVKDLNLKEILHENGINLRYMGLVRHHVQNIDIKQRIFIEMVARVIKHFIRKKMREQMKIWKLPLEHTCRKTVIDYLNLIFGSSKESTKYFDDVIRLKLSNNFVGALLTDDTEIPIKSMFEPKDFCTLFLLVQDMTALRFTSSALKEFSTYPSVYQYISPFHNTELYEIGVHVRHLNIVALAQGYVLKVGARSNQSKENTNRLCKLAIVKFQQALEDNPGDKRSLNELADTCSILGDYSSAQQYYLRAISADALDSNTLFRYAVFLEEKLKSMEEAEEYYIRTLEVNPTHDHCLQRYGHFLENQGNPDAAEEFFISASEVRRVRMMGSQEQETSDVTSENFIF